MKKMNIYLLLSASGLLAVITFVSCQKDFSIENGILPGVITTSTNHALSDSNNLDKIFEVVSSGSILDTQHIITFHYDSQGRVTSMNDSTITSSGPVLFLNNRYSYSGNDTLPYLSIWERNVGLATNDSFITYHTYDAVGRNLKDSACYTMTPDPDKYIINYSYSAGKMYRQTFDNKSAIILTKDTAITDADGDPVSRNEWTSYNYAPYMHDAIYSFTYDGHKSPFANLSSFKAQSDNIYSWSDAFYTYLLFKNPTTRQENDVTGNPNNSETATYVYNAAGFPLRANRSMNGSPEILFFTYKHL